MADLVEVHMLEHTNVSIRTHLADKCAGQFCTIHNRSNHSMRSFPQWYRWDRGFMERTCPHGVGHPDPDDPFADPIHGCCGESCCG